LFLSKLGLLVFVFSWFLFSLDFCILISFALTFFYLLVSIKTWSFCLKVWKSTLKQKRNKKKQKETKRNKKNQKETKRNKKKQKEMEIYQKEWKDTKRLDKKNIKIDENV
jgi:membrane protein insertase Oxa1/YidC/SpoIIIJ